MRKTIFLLLALIVILLLPLSASASVVAPNIGVFDSDTPLEYNEIRQLLKTPQPRIEIPGLKLTPAQELPIRQSESGNLYINIPYIGQYIAAIYRYGVVVISIIAVINIIVAGIQYMLPGNVVTSILTKVGGERQETQTNKAKEAIAHSLVALLIAVGSYVLLYTINPELVQFRNLKILFVQGEEFDGSEATGEKKSTDPNRCGGAAGDKQNLFAGLDGSLHQYAKYSTKYGPTCKTKVQPKAIILHYTAGEKGTPAGVVKFWSSDESPGTVCQIIVDRAGKAYQVTNSLEEKVICHGSHGFNWNTGGIGIEVMGKNEKEINANTAQKQATVDLVKRLAAHYNIPLTNSINGLVSGSGGIFTHEQVTKCQGAPHLKEDSGEDYAKEILRQAGATYVDWTNEKKCQR